MTFLTARVALVRFAMAGGGGGAPPPPPPPAGGGGGNFGPNYYAPPPAPPRRGLSPWAWVGIGCGALLLLGFGGCLAFVNTVRNSFQQSTSQPLSPQSVAASLGGVPIHPGATLDTDMTRGLRAAFELANKISFGKLTFHAGAYRVSGIAPDKLAAWYDTKLKAAGWKTMPRPPSGFNSRQQGITHQSQYAKGDLQAVVQIGGPSAMRRGRSGGGESSGGSTAGATGSTLLLTVVKGAGSAN